MAAPAEQGRVNTYQWLLRALGAYLDEQPSCRISIAEVPDGFLVRFQRTFQRLDPEVYRFDYERLREQLETLFNERKTLGPVRHEGIWSSFPNGHADFFRALGYELDQESARSVLIDELDDGIIVTYFRIENDGWKKRMVFLSVDDIEKMLHAAYARRSENVVEAHAPARA